MTAPREEIIAKVRAWATHAEDDLRVAQHTLTLSHGCPYHLVAYHAQQCAEKYLKAYLVLRGVDCAYMQNIASLLSLCSRQAAWGRDLKDADELTPLAITARYPGEDESVSEAEARRALDFAARVREVVRHALDDEGVSL